MFSGSLVSFCAPREQSDRRAVLFPCSYGVWDEPWARVSEHAVGVAPGVKTDDPDLLKMSSRTATKSAYGYPE